jgi:hypothetical protein
LVLLTTLAACRAPKPDQEIVADAKGVLDAVAHRELDGVAARLDESLRGPLLIGQLNTVADQFPAAPPAKVRVVGYTAGSIDIIGGSKTETVDVTLESSYSDQRHLVSEIVFKWVDGGARRIIGLHVNSLPAPLEVFNAFTFSNKGPLHFVFLAVMLAVAATTLAALVVWRRRRHALRHRWRWLVAILLGAFNFTLNWTTGALGLQVLTLQGFSLGFGRQGEVGPWILTVAIPAGAIAFLVSQRGPTPAAPSEPASGPPPVESPPHAA